MHAHNDIPVNFRFTIVLLFLCAHSFPNIGETSQINEHSVSTRNGGGMQNKKNNNLCFSHPDTVEDA